MNGNLQKRTSHVTGWKNQTKQANPAEHQRHTHIIGVWVHSREVLNDYDFDFSVRVGGSDQEGLKSESGEKAFSLMFVKIE